MQRSVKGLGVALEFFALLCIVAALVLSPAAAAAGANSRVTDQTYVRHDGGSDRTIASCSSDTPTASNGGNRQQNEPTVAVNPSNPKVIIAGANDYCGVPTFGDAWMGFYASQDGGAHWVNSLNPGYPTDTSTAGMASPIFGIDTSSGDPIMDWDNNNNLFYGGIAFNRVATNPSGLVTPTNANAIVSTWTRDASAPLGVSYVRTVIVGEGTPSAFFEGRFNDKPSLKVDQWPGSPNQGNVYVAWTLFPGHGQDQILFSRSTDQGATFSAPMKISKGIANAQGSSIAVAKDGTVYVVWRQFAFLANGVDNAIVFVKSTDGGQSFSNPQVVRTIVPYDRSDASVTGGRARDCGDGPFACVSGFTFHREDALPAAVADDQNRVFVTWAQVFDPHASGSTYSPGGQAQIVVSISGDGGKQWSDPAAVDRQSVGHQFFPFAASGGGAIYVAYYDSRNDPAYSPDRPPGNDPAGVSAGPSLDVFASVSTDGGSTWTHHRVTDVSHNPNYEMFGGRRVPFHGDYIYVGTTIDGNHAQVVWTDNRDVVAGTDPRDAAVGHVDGNDVHQCRATATSPDTCPNAGGLNQNIFTDQVMP